MPGVGSGTENPTAPVTWVCAWPSTSLVRAAPACRLTAAGSRLPPITRKSACPPHDVTRSMSESESYDATPAVSVSVPRPRDARPAHVVPPPYTSFGFPKSPLMVTPVPPLGLFHTGIPSHCPAVGAASEHAMPRAVVELLGVVGEMDSHRAEADVATHHPPEVDLLGIRARHVPALVVPHARREVRLDADEGRRQRHAHAESALRGGGLVQ